MWYYTVLIWDIRWSILPPISLPFSGTLLGADGEDWGKAGRLFFVVSLVSTFEVLHTIYSSNIKKKRLMKSGGTLAHC